MLFGDGHGCQWSKDMVREKISLRSGNVTLSQVMSWKEIREKGNFKSTHFIYIHNVCTLHEIE